VKKRAPQDPLTRYRARRHFDKSGEPRGGAARKGGRRLVVQRHFARREHFDLRLEMDGVLKSWAVTRGPSANPADKRLAVRTEDHPLEYGSFEGAIPKGEYGAGVVELWEDATYEPLNGDPEQALAKGKLEFLTLGARMRGRWALVAMKKRDKAENWLLIKERDEFAEADDSLAERFDTSVASGRTREEIERGAPSRRKPGQKNTHTTDGTRQAARAPTPAFVPPQLCETADDPPRGEDWLFEMKYDGYRLELAAGAEGAKVYTRTGLDWSARFPGLARAVFELPCKSALLDGEAVVLDARGLSDFAALVAALEARDQSPIEFCAFDLLVLDGRDLRDRPLRSRKEKLRELLALQSGAIRYAEDIRGDGAAVFAQATKAGAEGIVAKRQDAPYRSGRFADWRKIKGDKREDVEIIGYRPSNAGESFASLLAARDTPQGLRYVGSIGTGYSARTRERLAPLIAGTRKTKPELSGAGKLPKDAIYLERPFAAETRFGGWTGDGLLRHARFLGVREDRARPKREASKRRDALAPVTHADRVVYPADGITKGDVAAYYEKIWPRIAPHLEDRVVSLVRAPDNIEKLFFQRHPLAGMNGSVLKVDCDDETYIALAGASGLHAAAQFGAIELHGWMARRDDLVHPDRLIFDLDPAEDVSFTRVIEAAADLREYLAALGLKTWPMVTGGKGAHVVAPLDRTLPWPEIEAFAEGFARIIAQQQRTRFVATMSKRRREGRIFIDWLRNKKKATAILPWSLRARPGAPVAAPVSWNTFGALSGAAAFHIHSAPELANEWGAFGEASQTISHESRELIGKALAQGARKLF
jgi:bifunctional non-homologous end joining protein LigD